MSQFSDDPPPPPPQPPAPEGGAYDAPAAPPSSPYFLPPEPPKKPATLMVFAIINLIIGGGGLCCNVFSVIQPFMPAGDPMNEAFNADKTYVIMTVGMGIVSMIMSGVLLAGGIGLLQGKPWGRLLTLGWAVTAIAQFMVYLVYVFTIVFPIMDKVVQNAPNTPAMPAGMIGIMKVMMIGAAVPTGLVYPGLLLFFMNVPVVKKFLAKASGGPSQESGMNW